MKRVLLAAAIASGLALATAAVAQDKPSDSPKSSQMPASMHGTVTSVDNSAKSFTLKDDSTGKETTVFWDSSTKLSGDLKVGSMVNVQSNDSSGRKMATSVEVTSAKKPY